MTRLRICNNCSQAYGARRRKCPIKGCKAPKRFSCEESDEQATARRARWDAQEALIQELAAAR